MQNPEQINPILHDIKNKLTTISGAAHLLNDECSPLERDQIVEMLSRNLTTIRPHLSELVRFSYLETDGGAQYVKLIVELVREVYSQLPATTPTLFQDQIRALLDELNFS